MITTTKRAQEHLSQVHRDAWIMVRAIKTPGMTIESLRFITELVEQELVILRQMLDADLGQSGLDFSDLRERLDAVDARPAPEDYRAAELLRELFSDAPAPKVQHIDIEEEGHA